MQNIEKEKEKEKQSSVHVSTSVIRGAFDSFKTTRKRCFTRIQRPLQKDHQRKRTQP